MCGSLAQWTMVALGGALGSVARVAMDQAVRVLLPAVSSRFPIGILTVNALGCAVFGFICGLSGTFETVPAGRRFFLLSGLLGGFTTFSTFGHDTARLLQQGSTGLAALNAAMSVTMALLAVFGGWWLGQRMG